MKAGASPFPHSASVPHPCDFFLSQGWDNYQLSTVYVYSG